MAKYSMTNFEITESLIYYLSNTGSVEIRTKFGLRKIYFRIPASLIALSQPISRRILEEMMETKQQEAIKSICYKALLIKERIGSSKNTSKLVSFGRYLINNITRLSDLMFILLLLFLAFEISYKVTSNSLLDVASNLTNALVFILSLIIYLAFFIDSYQVKKHKLKTMYIFKHKSKSIRGSLGFNAFPRSINNDAFKDEQKELGNQTSEVTLRCRLSFASIKNFVIWLIYSRKIRIIYYMLIDKVNFFNLLLVIIMMYAMQSLRNKRSNQFRSKCRTLLIDNKNKYINEVKAEDDQGRIHLIINLLYSYFSNFPRADMTKTIDRVKESNAR